MSTATIVTPTPEQAENVRNNVTGWGRLGDEELARSGQPFNPIRVRLRQAPTRAPARAPIRRRPSTLPPPTSTRSSPASRR